LRLARRSCMIIKKGEVSAMDKQRVLLLCTQSLLGESLQAILSQEASIELIGPWAPDGQGSARVAETAPDVVLIADDTGSTTGALTAQILDQHPSIPVIRVGLEHNVVCLYTSSTLPACSSDLLRAIRSLTARRAGEEA